MTTAIATTNANKYASEYPLPGGVEQYFDTLIALLRFIRDNKATPNDLTNWIFRTFPNASGQIAANGYISCLSRLGLWSQQRQIRLTPEGTTLVNKVDSVPEDARQMVVEIKYRNFSGYEEMLKLLRGGPQDDGGRGSLYTRVSPTTLTNKLSQIARMMDLSELPKT